MAYAKDTAVSLRRLDFSESSQVLVFYTAAHGKQRLIAKGIKRATKKRFAAGIDLLELGEVVFSHRDRPSGALGVLTEWRQLSLFMPLRADLRRLYAAQYVAEITSQLTAEDDAHPGLFERLIDALEGLCSTDRVLGAVVEFQAALLTDVGLMPMLDACVSCGRTSGTTPHEYFSSVEGGLLCRNCEPHRVEKRQVSPRAIEALRLGRKVPDDAQLSAFDLFDYHITHLTGGPLRLSPFLAAPASRRTVV